MVVKLHRCSTCQHSNGTALGYGGRACADSCDILDKKNLTSVMEAKVRAWWISNVHTNGLVHGRESCPGWTEETRQFQKKVMYEEVPISRKS